VTRRVTSGKLCLKQLLLQIFPTSWSTKDGQTAGGSRAVKARAKATVPDSTIHTEYAFLKMARPWGDPSCLGLVLIPAAKVAGEYA